MGQVTFPFVILPSEFVTLLKTQLLLASTSHSAFELIRPNKALLAILESTFSEFDDGRGIEKVFNALGWPNFREKMASIYIYKTIYGDFPSQTDVQLVEEIKDLENLFSNHSVNSYSRIFLLGFYLKMANIKIQRKDETSFSEIKIPSAISTLLKISQGRSEKIDWLILILTHFYQAFGEELLAAHLSSGKKFDEIYQLLTAQEQELMSQNLLAYGASIGELEVFLYEKI